MALRQLWSSLSELEDNSLQVQVDASKRERMKQQAATEKQEDENKAAVAKRHAEIEAEAMRITSDAAIERSRKLAAILGPGGATLVLAVERSSEAGIRLLPDVVGADSFDFFNNQALHDFGIRSPTNSVKAKPSP